MKQPNRLKKSVLAFVDILGYKDMIKSNKDNLDNLEEILDIFISKIHLSKWHIQNHTRSEKERIVKTFSDCFAIYYTLRESDSDIEVGETIEDLLYFQATLAIEGIFLRGGISIDYNYIDENIIFGNGIVSAYELESKQAIFPRIILNDALVEVIKNSIKLSQMYSYEKDIYLAKYLLKDGDEKWFLNYLFYVLPLPYENPERDYSTPMLLKHKANVIKNIGEHIRNEHICNKYIWVAQYHNWFCRKHFADNNDLIIDIDTRTFYSYFDNGEVL